MEVLVDGKNINYEIQGRGEPMLFVHGWGGSLNSLRKLADFASKEYKTILIDLPGFGLSDNPDSNWGVEEYAQLIVHFLQKLKIQSVDYVGHSFGGSLGIYISSHKPELIRNLVLCNSAYKREQKTSHKASQLKRYGLKYIPFFNYIQKPFKHIVYRIFFPNSDLVKFPHLESNFRRIVTQDLTRLVDKVEQRTLIMWGSEDSYTPVRYAHELHKLIKGSKIKIFPNIRHNLPLLYPDLVWKEMQEFLSQKQK